MKKLFIILFTSLFAFSTMNAQITVKVNLGGATASQGIYLHSWSNQGETGTGTFPGALMTDNGNGWYSYTFNPTITSVNVMFSHGNGTINSNNQCQTPSGIAITQSACFSWALLPGIQATTADCNSTPPSGNGVKIRWRKGADINWANMGIYEWSSGGGALCGTWPGISVTPDGDGWYEYTFTETPEHIIFNNFIATMKLGGKQVNGPVSQTSDICLEIHPTYYCIANCETGNAPCSELENFIVKWDNAQGWSDMYIYAWIGDEGITELFGAYPGEAVTPVNGFYSKTFVKATPVKMIFISPESGAQTSNITGVFSDACYTITSEIEYNELEQPTNVAQLVSNCNYSSVTNLLADGFVIVPNPVKDYLVINSDRNDKFLIEIYDVNGKLHILQLLPISQKINVVDLNPGIYFIKIGDVIKKFVKE